ncbi:hypothetical protein [Methylobacterium gnaphalii]|uniref:Uncharacterized protein n=1 Tax=Methylobacterium gnaphalii TaxID=1010610 RepID=A0A512JSB6_9HYPH|nr:hypothetical protein [Methylobacterium gnaphalii]GEP12783.1 hypothetical protein MGN01_46280 [Methylobacterium gnaphalii]GJD68442.1 hypothetical protein MMMDOFMJ_1365 [Methylobacterium gnaphalii]GLS51002.1 hypothetical protein GCM10007885_38560 [Methylobacterium gnaphalii]
MTAARERHPESSKKEIVRAAFYALTEGDTVDPEQGKQLHGFAISERATDEEAPIKRSKLGKKKRKAAQKASAS